MENGTIFAKVIKTCNRRKVFESNVAYKQTKHREVEYSNKDLINMYKKLMSTK